MTSIDRELVREALKELSDAELQRRLWKSDGAGGSDVSSFAEVVEQLFTDTGLANLLHAGQTGLGKNVEAVLFSLEQALLEVDPRHRSSEIINDPAMTHIRKLAGRLLDLM